jgi:hypothetical protein
MDKGTPFIRFELTKYTPAEAAMITKLSPPMQRDWRHKGFLDTHQRHARYDVFDIAEMSVKKLFADQGKGPSQSKEFAPEIARAVVWTAVTWSERAWAVSPSIIFDQLPEKPTMQRGNADEKLFWIAEQLFHHLHIERKVSGPHAIWWPDNTVEVGDYSQLSTALSAQGTEIDEPDPKFEGASTILPLDTLAASLVRKAPRPFVSMIVQVPDAENAS